MLGSQDILLSVLSPAIAVIHRAFDSSNSGDEPHLVRQLVHRLPATSRAESMSKHDRVTEKSELSENKGVKDALFLHKVPTTGVPERRAGVLAARAVADLQIAVGIAGLRHENRLPDGGEYFGR